MNDLTDLTTGTMTSELAMTSSIGLANSTTGGIEVERHKQTAGSSQFKHWWASF